MDARMKGDGYIPALNPADDGYDDSSSAGCDCSQYEHEVAVDEAHVAISQDSRGIARSDYDSAQADENGAQEDLDIAESDLGQTFMSLRQEWDAARPFDDHGPWNNWVASLNTLVTDEDNLWNKTQLSGALIYQALQACQGMALQLAGMERDFPEDWTALSVATTNYKNHPMLDNLKALQAAVDTLAVLVTKYFTLQGEFNAKYMYTLRLQKKGPQPLDALKQLNKVVADGTNFDACLQTVFAQAGQQETWLSNFGGEVQRALGNDDDVNKSVNDWEDTLGPLDTAWQALNSAEAQLARAQWDYDQAKGALDNCNASSTCDPGDPDPLPLIPCDQQAADESTAQANFDEANQAWATAQDEFVTRCEDWQTARDTVEQAWTQLAKGVTTLNSDRLRETQAQAALLQQLPGYILDLSTAIAKGESLFQQVGNLTSVILAGPSSTGYLRLVTAAAGVVSAAQQLALALANQYKIYQNILGVLSEAMASAAQLKGDGNAFVGTYMTWFNAALALYNADSDLINDWFDYDDARKAYCQAESDLDAAQNALDACDKMSDAMG